MKTESIQKDRVRHLPESLKGIVARYAVTSYVRQLLSNPIVIMLSVAAVSSALVCLWSFGHLSSLDLLSTCLIWGILIIAVSLEAHILSRRKTPPDAAPSAHKAGVARKLVNGTERAVQLHDLKEDDLVICEKGDIVPADGEVIQGTAMVDESVITGESPAVLRESGGDHNRVFAKTVVLGGRIIIRVAADHGAVQFDGILTSTHKLRHILTPDERLMSRPMWLLVVAFSLVFAVIPVIAHPGMTGTRLWLYGIDKIPLMLALLVAILPFSIAHLMNLAELAAARRLMDGKIVPANIETIMAAGNVDSVMMDAGELVCFDSQLNIGSTFGPSTPVDPDPEGDGSPVEQMFAAAEHFHAMHLRTIVSSGESALVAAWFAAEVGADDFVCGQQAEQKIAMIRSEQNSGRSIAALGTSDERAVLKAANIAFIVDGGMELAGESERAVGLNGKPSRVIELIRTGRKLAVIQRALISFGIASTLSIAIVSLYPLFGTVFGNGALVSYFPAVNFLALHSPGSAMIDVMVFQTLVLALAGLLVSKFFFNNEKGNPVIFDVGPFLAAVAGLVFPMCCTKAIDLCLVAFRIHI